MLLRAILISFVLVLTTGCSFRGPVVQENGSGKYEVILTDSKWELTFRLDTSTGMVWALQNSVGTPLWLPYPFKGDVPKKREGGSYELRYSKLGGRVVLFECQSGATWVLQSRTENLGTPNVKTVSEFVSVAVHSQ